MQVYSVTDYGAKGNGVTDDTAAIQSALDAAEAAGGGTVVLSAGTYIVSSSGTASDGALRVGSNVTLAGAGMGDTTIKLRDGSSGDVTGIVRTHSGDVTHDVVIRDLTIDGNSANTGGSVDGIFTGVTPGVELADHDILIQSVEVKNVSRYAFDPHEQTVRLTIVDSHAHDNGRDGFTIDYISQSVFVDNVSANNGRHGFNVVTSSHHNLMVDNIAYGNAGNGLVTQNGSDLRPWTSDITVVGGEYYGNGLTGILVKVSRDVTIFRADVHDNAREGIMISGSVDTRLIDNEVYNNSRSKPGGYQEIRWADMTSGDYVDMTGKTWAVRNVTVADEARIDSGTISGTTAMDIRTAGEGDDRLIGGGGNDYLDGGAGSDTAVYDKTIDQFRILFTSTGKLMVFDMTDKESGSGIDVLENIEAVEFAGRKYTVAELREREAFAGYTGYEFRGYNSAETFVGGVTDDYLDGRGGADTLVGGWGDDTYVVDNVKDRVVELDGAGVDLVIASETTRLSDNVENLELTGGALGGYGNAMDNVITGSDIRNELKGYGGDDRLVGNGGDDALYGYEGNDLLLGGEGSDDLSAGNGDDTLDGGDGADTMRGGLGDDVFHFDDAGDVIVEYNNQGRDKVIAFIDAVLADKVEDLELAAGVVRGSGNSLANSILGNDASNILDGAGGADTMMGGLGDDTYHVDNAGDRVVEADRQGSDTVIAAIDHTLADFVENLTMASGTAGLSGTGNGLANRITGNDGANRLDGGLGNDTLLGGKGDDTYIVDSRYDSTVERAGEGHDQVRASTDVVLAAQVEDLTLTDGALKGTGNELDNRIVGTERGNTLSGLDGDDKLYGLEGNDTLMGGNGADFLDGGVGRDAMWGGNGDDTYIVDEAGDTVTEHAQAGQGGRDKVLAGVSFVSSGNIEQIVLTGTGALDATGDSIANEIIGNDAANRINGAGGDDLLTGAGGADTFVFVDRFGKDVVTDFDAREDRLDFSHADISVDPESIMRQVGNDVVFEFSRSMTLTLLDVNLADLQDYTDWII